MPKGLTVSLILGLFLASFCGADEQVIPADAMRTVTLMRDSRIPIGLRMAELRSLARKGDETAVKSLLAVAGTQTYLNRFAAEALGRVTDQTQAAAVRAFLAGHLADPDALYAAACVRGLARLDGKAAVTVLAEALQENTVREDGLAEMVCSAIVEQLGGLGSPEAAAVLAAELDRSGRVPFSLEYGARVVRSLAMLGCAESAPSLRAYADRLTAGRPADLLAGPYFDGMIAEALRVADLLD